MTNRHQTLVILLGISILLAASGTSMTIADDLREVELPGPPHAGPGRIPHHHGPITLEEIAQQSTRNSFGSVSLQFRQWIESRNGALVIPPNGLRVGSRGTILVQPTEVLLSQWSKSLPEAFLDHALGKLASIPIDGAHPLLWQPGQEAAARRALAEAVERGDRAGAAILLRRDGLAATEDPAILSWIYNSRSVSPLWRRTDGVIATSATIPSNQKVEAIVALPHAATGADGGSFTIRQGLKTRRQPLADFHPLKREETILVGAGNQIFALDLNDSLNQLWAWKRFPHDEATVIPPLMGIPEIPISSGDRCVFLFRTPRKFQQPTTNLLGEKGPWKGAGWLEAVVLEIPDPRLPPESSWSPHIALEGFTTAATPHIDGDHLWLVATRGWSEVETWVFAFDIARHKELWRRKLSMEQLSAHSLRDLRDKIAQVSIARRHDDLIVSRSCGAIDLLSASSGEHRATLQLPRWITNELPSHSGVRWGNHRFQSYPQIRSRNHAAISVPSNQNDPWILIPHDGKILIALEQNNWRIRWSRPASRETTLLGIKDGLAWILDAGVTQGERQISLVGVDPRYGNEKAGPWQLTLMTPEPKPTPQERSEVAPMLRGVPRLVGQELWVPTSAGIEVFSTTDGSYRELKNWPQGSGGGTPLPLDNGRMLVTRRGDTAVDTSSAIELLVGETEDAKRD